MLPGDKTKASKEYRASAARARRTLRRRGWSYRRAAIFLEITFTHFSKVVGGERPSNVLLARIQELPNSPIPYRVSGFALKSAA